MFKIFDQKSLYDFQLCKKFDLKIVEREKSIKSHSSALNSRTALTKILM